MFKSEELHNEIESCVEKTKKKLTKGKYAVAIIEGNNFKNFTKYMKRPFDVILRNAMERTMLEICSRVNGCIIGFTESDSISIVFRETDKGFFLGGEVFNLTSFFASHASMFFNQYFEEEYYNVKDSDDRNYNLVERDLNVYREKMWSAYFRVNIIQFNKKDLNKLLCYQQKQAFRNCGNLVAYTFFDEDQIKGKALHDQIELLKEKKRIDFYKYPRKYRMGCMCVKTRIWKEEDNVYTKLKWRIVDTINFEKEPEYIIKLIDEEKEQENE
jgi:tRNA(His) 5'-end guanylyltransferase